MDCLSAPIPTCMPAAAWEFAQRLSVSRVVRFSPDLNSNHRAFQGHQCSSVVDVLAAARDTFLSALFRALGPIDIDLMRAFCCFRKNTHMVRLNFHKSPGNGEKKPSVGFAISDLSHVEF